MDYDLSYSELLKFNAHRYIQRPPKLKLQVWVRPFALRIGSMESPLQEPDLLDGNARPSSRIAQQMLSDKEVRNRLHLLSHDSTHVILCVCHLSP
jgi:hypothetical protein